MTTARFNLAQTRPVWLLDVDGVINVNRPGDWGGKLATGQASDGRRTYTLRWAPALIDRIRALATSGLVDIRWCTTWCPWAEQLEALWDLPKLDRAWTEDINGQAAATAKLEAAERVIASGGPLIWTDDTETPGWGPLYDEWTADGRALLIQPSGWYGLRPADMDAIEGFVSKGGAR